MINNLELVLCAENYKGINEPSLTSSQKLLAGDILPDTYDDKPTFKFPIHLKKKFNRAA